ncbi:RNase adapter RapZ [Nisaea acidiphila]|uniref:RNase adapter RapZ n=1 Tax=Nisaea acidiphila TaxID=1862145 RepID=A0A9J7AVN1_9PROT|nr:RNase adapter RapZ [Nisaea acidiphila]UUX51827.1 RNase adapter RapZ [Nisaea acidiphila]
MQNPAASEGRPIRVVLVTGLSGAGRTTSLKALEDAEFEAVDNLPLSLLPALLAPRPGDANGHRIAIGIDTRTRDFTPQRLTAELEALRNRSDIALTLVFLDCDTDVLIRRFTETRRRHPLAMDRPVADGIRTERGMLAPLREQADVTIDTSRLSTADFKRVFSEQLGFSEGGELTVTVTSFSFRRGLPREADMVFDVRFLRNPHYDEALRPLDGRDAAVADYVAEDPDFAAFYDRLVGFLTPLMPRFRAEGKSYVTIAIGCTGGRHRSVFVAERVARELKAGGLAVTLLHRDVDRSGQD